MEMAALANHRKELRTEIARYAVIFREQQRAAFVTALQRHGVLPDEVPPIVVDPAHRGLDGGHDGRGPRVTAGHAETLEVVERYLTLMEGEPGESDSAHQWRNEHSAPLAPEFCETTTPSTASTQ